MRKVIGFVLAVVGGYLLGHYSQTSCPPPPAGATYLEAVVRQGRLSCIYKVEYIRPMHRQSYKLTTEERAMVAE